mmetsp:Transcript_3312/g.9737  ORF Transcript_3312/g.9737 Transcript_3312/m.9737 type:complete len:210 (-) Transcript_3312:585-1214(-)
MTSTTARSTQMIPNHFPHRRYRHSRSLMELWRATLTASKYTRSVLDATTCQLYMPTTSSCCRWAAAYRASTGSAFFSATLSSAFSTAWMIPATLASSASIIISSGSTSGTPPTLVLTTVSPTAAASTRATQNASVSEQFRKMLPCARNSRTSSLFTTPVSSTRSASPSDRTISSSAFRFGPSPPITNRTHGCRAHSTGNTRNNKSIPFL